MSQISVQSAVDSSTIFDGGGILGFCASTKSGIEIKNGGAAGAA